jgi:hypothetical protein
MASSCEDEEVIETFQESFGPSTFIGNARVLGTSDAALNGVLVQALEDLRQRWAKIEAMKIKRSGRYKAGSLLYPVEVSIDWPYLYILPSLLAHAGTKRS